jgi:hypothetical protein
MRVSAPMKSCSEDTCKQIETKQKQIEKKQKQIETKAEAN